jgi:DNA-binding beta-propeller fold protein YncE
VVTDACNHRIGRFTLDGVLIGWIGSPLAMGDGPGQFRFPYGLASLGDGTVMVSEYGGNRVQRIDLASGQGLGTWGHTGRGDGELAAPWAVAVVGREAFVVDSGNNRVIEFATPRRKG